MAKYQRQLGFTSEVVVRKGYDIFGQQKYYGDHFIGFSKKEFKQLGPIGIFFKLCWRTVNTLYFYCYVSWYARNFDVVHIHSQYLVSLFLPWKSVVIEFHGNDIRKKPSKRWRIDKWVTSFYLWLYRNKQFYISTPDLLFDLPTASYIPNPIDTEHFFKRKDFEAKSALYIHNWHDAEYTPIEIAQQLGLDLKTINRSNKEFIQYPEFPQLLSAYEFFIDRHNIKSLSKTALEALAMGLKIIDSNNNVIEGLPEEHDPVEVAKLTIDIYEKEIHYEY